MHCVFFVYFIDLISSNFDNKWVITLKMESNVRDFDVRDTLIRLKYSRTPRICCISWRLGVMRPLVLPEWHLWELSPGYLRSHKRGDPTEHNVNSVTRDVLLATGHTPL